MLAVKTAVTIVVVGCAVALGIAILWLLENDFEFYVRCSSRVSDGNNAVADARTFKARRGHLLITMPESRSAPYIFPPEYHEVLLCNSHTFVSLGVFGLQKRGGDGRYPCAGSVKQEVEQQVEQRSSSLAFNSWRNGAHTRIRVDW